MSDEKRKEKTAAKPLPSKLLSSVLGKATVRDEEDNDDSED